MSPITTHVLDIGSGKPAAGVLVVLERIIEGGPELMAEGATDQDGRITSWLSGPVASTRKWLSTSPLLIPIATTTCPCC